ncbi:MAG TPA: hypothetical protein VK900_10070 [Anaerolineales bacterium]|nr:hypothetical protein [Anaerolineales bacterium]
MSSKKLIYLVVALSMTLAGLFPWSHVLAGSDNVTRGDVQAALQTWFTGLRALRFVGNAVAAAPLEGFQRGLIHPFRSDGAHFCVDDWHLVFTGWFTGGDQSFTHQDAVVDLSGIENVFILDGVRLSTKQTSIVNIVAAGFFEKEFGFAVGSILSPDDLGVGEHTLTYVFTFPDGFSDSNTITFFVDPPGSGACAQ